MDMTMNLLMASSNAAGQGDGGMSLMLVMFLVFMIVYMWMISKKEKKQQQAEKDMRESLKIGDEVMTIGGIMGRVVTVKEDSIVVETGADRTKIRFTKQAIARNVTKEAQAEELKKAKIDAAKKAAEEKRAAKNK